MIRYSALFLAACVVAVFAAGCGGDGGLEGRGEEQASGKKAAGGGTTGPKVKDELGHQAFQPSTRIVAPAAEGEPLDRAARVLAGLVEDPLGTRMFVDSQADGLSGWREISAEEPDGYQLAYVTEGLLAEDGSKKPEASVDPGDFEMVAQTDTGFAVLVVKGDPEIETLQWEDMENFDEFLKAAKKKPGFVEVADSGAGTVYRAGTLALEREAGIDLAPKSPKSKTPVQAIYDGDVEAALMPADEVLIDVWSGELKAIAVLGEERCPDLPGVPTMEELGVGVSVPVFGGIAAPAGTPPAVVEELGRAFEEASSSSTFRRALRGTGREPAHKGPKEFAWYIRE